MKQPNVNVAIMSSKEVAFILYGDFKSTEFSDNFNGNIKAEFADGMIRLKTLTKEYKSVHEIIFNPVDPQNESFLLKGVTIGLQFHWEHSPPGMPRLKSFHIKYRLPASG